MPGLAQSPLGNAAAAPSSSCSSAAVGSVSGVWSKQRQDVDFDQLQKFWNGLLPHARREILRIDKHTLFEQARKNLYCSRCNGLLLEGFSQIVMYRKSLQQEGGGASALANVGDTVEGESGQAMDPSVHPWGGLIASRDGILTLKDCYLRGRSLWVLQNVFDSARARERERELLYPDACGGGGRGWISHGIATYGRLHGGRETCALHTARLSCDTLVDFWSALGDETRLSLFRMKEEDFIERLIYRFDSKRFCRDCRKNVIREFKELKELKRMRRETHCTTWFCAADSAFQYEVSRDKVQADWHQSIADSAGTYHHYEWAIGSGEGKSDILAFEDVGMTTEVLADGLELGGIDACYITLRACRLDGRCTELCVKAHALKGKSCVHRRLVVGDGFVTITKGESIRNFFDHAEEAEEEEEDDVIDKDGNDLDNEGSRPQKHAKSPELAREFLLDAATIIFKGQVEKAFREGTARQNAHSLFVCLALKLLEERLHVACKEIITFEKQVKLLEEEEREKREEEERRERRRAKEREKKLRRKERLREKEHEKERKDGESDPLSSSGILEELSTCPQEAPPVVLDENGAIDKVGEPMSVTSTSPENRLDQHSDGFICSKSGNLISCTIDGEVNDRESNGSFILEQSRSCRRRLRFDPDPFAEHVFEWSRKGRYAKDDECNVQNGGSELKSNGCSVASSRCNNGGRCPRESFAKTAARNPTLRFDKLVHGSNRSRCRHDFHSCSCNQVSGYRGKDSQFAIRLLHQNNRQKNRICAIDVPATSKEKPGSVKSNIKKQVWEPTDSWKKSLRNDMETTLVSRSFTINSLGQNENGDVRNCHGNPHDLQAPNKQSLSVDSSKSVNPEDCTKEADGTIMEENPSFCSNAFDLGTKPYYSKVDDDDEVDSSASPTSPLNNGCNSIVSSSSLDNCSSCISESDSSTSSSTARNTESSSMSDSEDVSQQFEGREMLLSSSNNFLAPQDDKNSVREAPFCGNASTDVQFDSCPGSKMSRDVVKVHYICKTNISHMGNEVAPQQQHILPLHNHSMHSAYVPFPTVGYRNGHPTSWSAAADTGMMPFPQPHPYMLPSPLGYSVPAHQPSDYHVSYGGVQPLTSQVLRPNQFTITQNVNKINTFNSNEQMRNFRVVSSNGNGFVDRLNFMPGPERSSSEKRCLSETSTRESYSMGNCDTLQGDVSSSFSLFHFNGPVALASGNSLDSSPPQSEVVLVDDSKQKFAKKETVVEEYSLFASTSGSRFSFF